MAVKKVTPKTKRKPVAKASKKKAIPKIEELTAKKRQSDQSTDQAKQSGA